MKYTCIIVDDEDLARELIEKYLKNLDFIEILASCSSAVDSLKYLNKNHVDIMFLDINMPSLDGLSLLKTLKTPPQVIITTAYREFAVEGYELDVVDYLCKPFSFERFLAAINRALGRMKREDTQRIEKKPAELHETPSAEKYIFVKTGKKSVRVEFDTILFIEAIGDYVKINTTSEPVVTYLYLKDIEQLLPADLFPRVHKSFIVSIAKIDSVEGNCIKIAGNIIPIGRNYKENFLRLIG